MAKVMKAFVDHPATRFLVGCVLVATGLVDLYGDLVDETRRFRIGAHHGIVILGIVQALSALPDFTLAFEKWLLVLEKKKGDRN
jgi:hypothetical protein